MTEQEQIEEMVAVMAASNDPFVDVPIEIMPQVAKALYNAGYRKVPDGAVVLTKEDLILYAKDCIAGEITGLEIINALIERAKRKAAEARKEAVKEFAEKLKSEMLDREYNGIHYKWGAFSDNDIDELLKEYEE